MQVVKQIFITVEMYQGRSVNHKLVGGVRERWFPVKKIESGVLISGESETFTERGGVANDACVSWSKEVVSVAVIIVADGERYAQANNDRDKNTQTNSKPPASVVATSLVPDRKRNKEFGRE